jgi:hypothetical protein
LHLQAHEHSGVLHGSLLRLGPATLTGRRGYVSNRGGRGRSDWSAVSRELENRHVSFRLDRPLRCE